MGAIGGGFWHTYRGLKNSPKGYKFKGTVEVGGVVGLDARTCALPAGCGVLASLLPHVPV